MKMSTASFKRAERLVDAIQYRKVLKDGRVTRRKWVALYYLRTARTLSRLGIIVSRKASKRAVDRNRFKRVTREFFRQKKGLFREPFEMVVRASGNCEGFRHEELREILEALFQDARILRK